MSKKHHPWCNLTKTPVEGCYQCALLYRDYPFKRGETRAQAMERYFPKAQPIEPKPSEPNLIMVQPGRPELIHSNEVMQGAVEQLRHTHEEMERFLKEESVRMRRITTRQGEEIERIETVRTSKTKLTRRRTDFVVLQTDGHQREVRKVKTTASKLEKDGRLTRDLKNYLDVFSRMVADGMGVATEDAHDSTNRLTSAYEPFISGDFGSKTLSDRQIDGIWLLQEMKNIVPDELQALFSQIIDEEVAGYSPLARTLSELGERLGYKHKQSSASGGTQVYCIVAMIKHFLKEKGILTVKPRQSDAA